MKLIKPATVYQEAVEFMQGSLSSCGKLSLSTCLIDFGRNQIKLGEPIDELKFGSTVYRGVLPLLRRKGGNLVECVVFNILETQ